MPVMDVNGGGNGCWGGMWFVWIIIIFALMGGGLGGWNNNRNYATQADVYAANDMQDIKGNQRAIQSGITSLGNGICDATYALNNTAVNGFANTNQNILQGNYALDKSVMQGDFMLDKSIMGGNFAIEKGITDSRFVIGNAVNDNRFAAQQGFNEMGKGLAENRFATQYGFNNVERNVDALRYDGAMNTCKITTNNNEGVQKILDKLSTMEFRAMKTENDNLRLALADARNVNVQFMQSRDIINAVRPYPQASFLVGNPNIPCPCPCNA